MKGEPALVPPGEELATFLEGRELAIVRQKITQLSLKGVIEEVPWETAVREPGLYSKLFCVAKKSGGGHRAIIGLSRFNDFVEKTF